MNYPQQGYYPPQQPPQQPPMPTGAATAVQQQAGQNVWSEVCNQPKRTPVNRQRIDDGTHQVHVKACTLKPSNKDGRLMLLFEFEVVASTAPNCVGQEYGFPQFMSNKMQLQDLSDIAKDIWGEQTVAEWARQGVAFADVAAYIAQTVTGKYCLLTARRSTREGETYDTAFVNHTFRSFVDSPQQLPELKSPCAPQMSQPPAMPQPPQGYGQPPQPGQPPAMPQPPQGYGQPPAMPQPPQGYGAASGWGTALSGLRPSSGHAPALSGHGHPPARPDADEPPF